MNDQPAASPTFFDHKIIDSVMTMCLELGAELWVTKERLRVVEALLAERQGITPDLIDGYQTAPAEAAAIAAARERFITRIYGPVEVL